MKITFPPMGKESVILKTLLKELNVEYILPSIPNEETYNIGLKVCPKHVGIAVKIIVGSIIESYCLGADTLVIACGSDYYSYSQNWAMIQEILLANKIKISVVFFDLTVSGVKNTLSRLKLMSNKISAYSYYKTRNKLTKITKLYDKLEELRLKHSINNANKGFINTICDDIVLRANKTKNLKELMSIFLEGVNVVKGLLNPKTPRYVVGLAGEYINYIEKGLNLNIEHLLLKHSIQLIKQDNFTDYLNQFSNKLVYLPPSKRYKTMAKKYLSSDIGGSALKTIGFCVACAKQGYNAVIHVYSQGNSAQTVAHSILNKVSDCEGIKILNICLNENSNNNSIKEQISSFIKSLEKSNVKTA